VSFDPWEERATIIPAALTANRERRRAAEAELAACRAELAELLVRGKRVGLSVSRMSRLAGVGRDKAHQLLRERGEAR
jgi:hypothetical protein